MTELMRDVVLSDDTVRGIELLASSLDWPCYVVDLRGCVDKTQLLERCADVLRFPSWFGQNWDAFFDCLADLSWRPARGYVLLLEHADTMRHDAPEALDTALAILGDAASAWESRGVPFRVFVSAPSPTDAG
mgnify:CR=1 FL=1